jgi:hypothetical protein
VEIFFSKSVSKKSFRRDVTDCERFVDVLSISKRYILLIFVFTTDFDGE